MNEGVYYYVEKKPGLSYEESYIRCLCTGCKTKLFSQEKMMFYNGKFGEFEVKCFSCEKIIREAQCQKSQ
jgi:hypothetical protein